MMSLGAGIRWATVSLLNNTSVCTLASDWLSPPRGRWRLQRAARMLHSSRTSSTSSTSTPGLSAGEQRNSTDVECVCVRVPKIYKTHADAHRALIHVELMHYKINSLLSICAAALDAKMLNSTGRDAWSCTKALTPLLGLSTDAARGKLRRANGGYTLRASIKRR